MSTKIQLTAVEAIREVNKQKRGLKRVGHCVFVRPFMPTTENRGFEGCSLVRVTKKEFIKAIQDCLRNFEDRGAKIELTIPTEDFEAFIIG